RVTRFADVRWLAVSATVALVCGCFAWDELRYLMLGRIAQATVIGEFRGHPRNGDTVSITYMYQEANGMPRVGDDEVAAGLIPADGKFVVQYVPGIFGDVGRSRLVGHTNWVALSAFAISVVVAGAFLALVWTRESKAAHAITSADSGTPISPTGV